MLLEKVPKVHSLKILPKEATVSITNMTMAKSMVLGRLFKIKDDLYCFLYETPILVGQCVMLF